MKFWHGKETVAHFGPHLLLQWTKAHRKEGERAAAAARGYGFRGAGGTQTK